jgi:hypothetical protein
VSGSDPNALLAHIQSGGELQLLVRYSTTMNFETKQLGHRWAMEVYELRESPTGRQVKGQHFGDFIARDANEGPAALLERLAGYFKASKANSEATVGSEHAET